MHHRNHRDDKPNCISYANYLLSDIQRNKIDIKSFFPESEYLTSYWNLEPQSRSFMDNFLNFEVDKMVTLNKIDQCLHTLAEAGVEPGNPVFSTMMNAQKDALQMKEKIIEYAVNGRNNYRQAKLYFAQLLQMGVWMSQGDMLLKVIKANKSIEELLTGKRDKFEHRMQEIVRTNSMYIDTDLENDVSVKNMEIGIIQTKIDGFLARQELSFKDIETAKTIMMEANDLGNLLKSMDKLGEVVQCYERIMDVAGILRLREDTLCETVDAILFKLNYDQTAGIHSKCRDKLRECCNIRYSLYPMSKLINATMYSFWIEDTKSLLKSPKLSLQELENLILKAPPIMTKDSSLLEEMQEIFQRARNWKEKAEKVNSDISEEMNNTQDIDKSKLFFFQECLKRYPDELTPPLEKIQDFLPIKARFEHSQVLLNCFKTLSLISGNFKNEFSEYCKLKESLQKPEFKQYVDSPNLRKLKEWDAKYKQEYRSLQSMFMTVKMPRRHNWPELFKQNFLEFARKLDRLDKIKENMDKVEKVFFLKDIGFELKDFFEEQHKKESALLAFARGWPAEVLSQQTGGRLRALVEEFNLKKQILPIKVYTQGFEELVSFEWSLRVFELLKNPKIKHDAFTRLEVSGSSLLVKAEIAEQAMKDMRSKIEDLQTKVDSALDLHKVDYDTLRNYRRLLGGCEVTLEDLESKVDQAVSAADRVYELYKDILRRMHDRSRRTVSVDDILLFLDKVDSLKCRLPDVESRLKEALARQEELKSKYFVNMMCQNMRSGLEFEEFQQEYRETNIISSEIESIIRKREDLFIRINNFLKEDARPRTVKEANDLLALLGESLDGRLNKIYYSKLIHYKIKLLMMLSAQTKKYHTDHNFLTIQDLDILLSSARGIKDLGETELEYLILKREQYNKFIFDWQNKPPEALAHATPLLFNFLDVSAEIEQLKKKAIETAKAQVNDMHLNLTVPVESVNKNEIKNLRNHWINRIQGVMDPYMGNMAPEEERRSGRGLELAVFKRCKGNRELYIKQMKAYANLFDKFEDLPWFVEQMLDPPLSLNMVNKIENDYKYGFRPKSRDDGLEYLRVTKLNLMEPESDEDPGALGKRKLMLHEPKPSIAAQAYENESKMKLKQSQASFFYNKGLKGENPLSYSSTLPPDKPTPQRSGKLKTMKEIESREHSSSQVQSKNSKLKVWSGSKRKRLLENERLSDSKGTLGLIADNEKDISTQVQSNPMERKELSLEGKDQGKTGFPEEGMAIETLKCEIVPAQYPPSNNLLEAYIEQYRYQAPEPLVKKKNKQARDTGMLIKSSALLDIIVPQVQNQKNRPTSLSLQKDSFLNNELAFSSQILYKTPEMSMINHTKAVKKESQKEAEAEEPITTNNKKVGAKTKKGKKIVKKGANSRWKQKAVDSEEIEVSEAEEGRARTFETPVSKSKGATGKPQRQAGGGAKEPGALAAKEEPAVWSAREKKEGKGKGANSRTRGKAAEEGRMSEERVEPSEAKVEPVQEKPAEAKGAAEPRRMDKMEEERLPPSKKGKSMHKVVTEEEEYEESEEEVQEHYVEPMVRGALNLRSKKINPQTTMYLKSNKKSLRPRGVETELKPRNVKEVEVKAAPKKIELAPVRSIKNDRFKRGPAIKDEKSKNMKVYVEEAAVEAKPIEKPVVPEAETQPKTKEMSVVKKSLSRNSGSAKGKTPVRSSRKNTKKGKNKKVVNLKEKKASEERREAGRAEEPMQVEHPREERPQEPMVLVGMVEESRPDTKLPEEKKSASKDLMRSEILHGPKVTDLNNKKKSSCFSSAHVPIDLTEHLSDAGEENINSDIDFEEYKIIRTKARREREMKATPFVKPPTKFRKVIFDSKMADRKQMLSEEKKQRRWSEAYRRTKPDVGKDRIRVQSVDRCMTKLVPKRWTVFTLQFLFQYNLSQVKGVQLFSLMKFSSLQQLSDPQITKVTFDQSFTETEFLIRLDTIRVKLKSLMVKYATGFTCPRPDFSLRQYPPSEEKFVQYSNFKDGFYMFFLPICSIPPGFKFLFEGLEYYESYNADHVWLLLQENNKVKHLKRLEPKLYLEGTRERIAIDSPDSKGESEKGREKKPVPKFKSKYTAGTAPYCGLSIIVSQMVLEQRRDLPKGQAQPQDELLNFIEEPAVKESERISENGDFDQLQEKNKNYRTRYKDERKNSFEDDPNIPAEQEPSEEKAESSLSSVLPGFYHDENGNLIAKTKHKKTK